MTACLFDLDGVLTQTAMVHNAAWKQTFDEFLAARPRGTGEPFVPFDSGADYHRYVDGRPRADGVRTFLASRGITLPEGTPGRPAGRARPSTASATARTCSCCSGSATDGVEVYPGSVRYLQAARDAGLRRAVVSASANCARRARRRRARGAARGPGRRRRRPRPRSCAASRAGHLPAAAPSCSASTRRRRPSSRTPSPAWRPAAPAASAIVVGVDRVGQADALRAHGADIVVSDLAELLRGCDLIERHDHDP